MISSSTDTLLLQNTPMSLRGTKQYNHNIRCKSSYLIPPSLIFHGKKDGFKKIINRMEDK